MFLHIQSKVIENYATLCDFEHCLIVYEALQLHSGDLIEDVPMQKFTCNDDMSCYMFVTVTESLLHTQQTCNSDSVMVTRHL